MPPTKNFLKRIEILDELLAARKWEWEELFNRVNEKLAEDGKKVQRSTFFNDLNYLEYDKGAPLHRPEAGNPCYYYTEDFSLKKLPLTPGDVTYLRDALDILRQVSNFTILEDVEEVVRKLENKVHTSTRAAQHLIQFEQAEKTIGVEHLDDVYTAVKNHQVLRIAYQPFTYPEPKELTVHPYLLKEYRNRWFLFGRLESTNSVSTFALDRIKKIKNSTDPFKENDIFNPDTYFTNLVGVSAPKDAQPETIVLKVAQRHVPYITTKPLHATQKTVTKYADGSVLLELTLIVNYELKSLLLSYGPGLEVIAPDSLRAELCQLLEENLKHYQSNSC